MNFTLGETTPDLLEGDTIKETLEEEGTSGASSTRPFISSVSSSLDSTSSKTASSSSSSSADPVEYYCKELYEETSTDGAQIHPGWAFLCRFSGQAEVCFSATIGICMLRCRAEAPIPRSFYAKFIPLDSSDSFEFIGELASHCHERPLYITMD